MTKLENSCIKCKGKLTHGDKLDGLCLGCWTDRELERNHIIYDRLAQI